VATLAVLAALPAAPQPAAADWDGTTAVRAADAWAVMPGLGIDIAIGADGTTWVVGTDGMPWRWHGTDWTRFPGERPGDVRRISVGPKGDPWVVTADGSIFEGSAPDGTWKAWQGKATDIAIGANGMIWIGANDANQSLMRWQVNRFGRLSFGAFRVAVAQDGAPWMVASDGQIHTIPIDDDLRQVRPGEARDIATGLDGNVWIVGTDGAPCVWNGEGWDRRPGAELTGMAVEPSGTLWAVNSQQQILRSTAAMDLPPARPGAGPSEGVSERERR
jgi:hypothetical protein